MKVEQNIERLKYLLDLFRIPTADFLLMVSEGLKKPLTEEDVFSNEISLSYLKRIDKVFNKGLHYYLDPKSPEISKDASIFFRKHKFGTDLNIGAKKIVNHFEELKISLSTISKFAEIKIERKIPVYSISNSPREVAKSLRELLYPGFNKDKKEFLKSLISRFADYNILVFEFVETWNKIEKANIDGFFLNPNVIVLKRQQSSFRREIFTLIHELGHYILNEEEIEELEVSNLANNTLNDIEKWCNDFAYYFLVGSNDNLMQEITSVDSKSDYHFELIEQISENTHLSKIALFTRLLFQKKISLYNYNIIKFDLEQQYKARQEEERRQRELEKQAGIKQSGSVPKPINSPLLISTIITAYYEGVVSEYDVCKTLNISADKLEKYLQ